MKCRWAIVGTGQMAGKFVIGLRSVPGAEVSLVASRSADRAATFAARFGVARAVGNYEDAALATDVDIVYVATPPSEHRAHALRFIAAGKPVLVEKPFAANAADAEAIITAARAAGVFCMEGMWTRFLPAIQLARSLVAAGRIGTPRSLVASFAIAERVDPENPIFRPELGGGVMGDRGVYPVSLAFDLLGPATLVSAAVMKGETGVDEEATAVLRHSTGEVSTIYAGARTTAENRLTLMGTEGTLRLIGPIYRPFGVEIERVRPRRRREAGWGRAATIKEGRLAQGLRQRLDGLLVHLRKRDRTAARYIGNGYAHEAMAVMDAWAEGRTEHPRMPLETTLAIVRLLDEIKATNVHRS